MNFNTYERTDAHARADSCEQRASAYARALMLAAKGQSVPRCPLAGPTPFSPFPASGLRAV